MPSEWYIQLQDPMADRLPEHRRDDFWNVMFRARKLLKGLDEDALRRGAMLINRIMRDAAYRDPEIHPLEHWDPMPYTLPNGTIIEAMLAYDIVDSLLYNMKKFDPATLQSGEPLDWPRLFALIALSRIEDACRWEAPWPEPHDDISKALIESGKLRKPHAIEDCLHEANHAVTVAEGLLHTANTVQMERSGQRKKAVSLRHHAITGEIKEHIRKLYLANHSHRTNRDAAKRIYSELIDSGELTLDAYGYRAFFHGKTVMESDDHEARIARWIADFKREGAI